MARKGKTRLQMGCFENDDWDIVALGCPDPDCSIHCWKEWVKGAYIWRGFSSEFQIQHHFLSTYCIPSSRHFLFTISGSSHCSWYFSYHTITWRHEPYVSRIHCLSRTQPWSSHLERGMYIYIYIHQSLVDVPFSLLVPMAALEHVYESIHGIIV